MADVNECLQNPCSNSVTCQNVPGSYTCVCNSGWTGQDCDIGKSIANSVIWLTQVHEFFGIVRLQYWVQLNYFTIKSTYNVSFIINLCYKYGLTLFFFTRYQRMFAEPLQKSQSMHQLSRILFMRMLTAVVRTKLRHW